MKLISKEEIKGILRKVCGIKAEYYLNETAKQIADLFPKGDEDGLLTDEEIMNAVRDGYEIVGGIEMRVIHAKSIAKAQQALTKRLESENHPLCYKEGKADGLELGYDRSLRKHQKEIAEIFEEIKKHYRDEGGLELFLSWSGVVIDEPDWQALQEKWVT